MNENPAPFYITTAIDYPNSVPHMGHAYEKVVADFYARASRLRGVPTRFLIGLDEHGQKIQEAAEQGGLSPQEFVDEKATAFRELYALLDISYDDFVRTSEPRHREFCQRFYERIRDAGDVYKGFYEGDYCISCEKFYTASELVDGRCPIHERPTTPVKEESYFFRLSKYREAILRHIEANPAFVYPRERRNEIVARLREDVRDLSISRSTFDWGIPVPDDPGHVLYVWFDALENYLSALHAPEDLSATFWPASCHVIGKDINWFHSVIWPAMLLSAGEELPAQVYVHGFILDEDGRKMAKHLGNVVDPLEIVGEYGVEVLRFYFLRSFASGHDGKFSRAELEDRYHAELANELGNLVLRVVKLIATRLGGEIATPGRPEVLGDEELIEEFFALVDGREHHRAMERLWSYIKRSNAYLNETEPWKLKDPGEFTAVLAECFEALRTVSHLLSPAMPKTAAAIGSSLGFTLGTLSERRREPSTYRVEEKPPLFPRRETAKEPKTKEKRMDESHKPKKGPPAPVDPFAKLALRVGRIVEVNEHPDADSLYAMTVDLGEDEPRSICAGLREYLPASDLQDRMVVVLANLKPAKLRGIESRGMILASDRKDGAVVPVDPGDAEIGVEVGVEGIESAPKKKLSKSEFEKAPLTVQGGRVSYAGKPLRTAAGPVLCDAEDDAPVR